MKIHSNFCRRFAAAVLAVAVATPAFAGETFAPFAAPAAASGSITYGQFSQFGGNSMLPPIPAGKIQFNRDSAYIAEGAILGGLLSSQVGTFIAVGALVIGGTAVAKNIKERITEGPCVADAAAGQIRNPADNYCGLPRTDGECPAGEVFAAAEADKCRPRGPDDCDAGAFLDGQNCRAPVAGDCPAQNVVPVVSGGRLMCNACGSGMTENTGGLSCRPRTPTDCDAGEFLDNTGNCRAPLGSDCSAPNMIPSVSGGLLSCDACGSGMTGDTGGLSCRPRTSTDCDAGEFLDGGNCRAPVGGDCSAPNMIPMIANRMLSCVACGSGLLEATAAELVCRPPQNNAECNALVTGEFLDNTNTCRAPVGGDCPAQNMIPSVSTGGVLSCVACGGDMIEATAAELTCRLPEDNGECGALTTGEIFDISEPDNCRPLVATDCDAGEFLDNTGDCRTPIDSDCPVQNQIAAVAAGVLTCRLPINNADCQAAYGDRVFDMTEATRCRTANRAELCTANPGNNDQFASQVFTPVPGGTVIRGMQGRTNSITLGDNSLAELFNRVNADGGGNENNRASRFRLRQGDGWLAAGGSQGGDQGQPGVGDIVRQPYFGPFQSRQFLQAGDVIAVLDDNTGNSNIAGNIVEIFQIYVGNGTLRLARGAAIPARIAGSTVTENAPTGCTVTGTQFFLDDDWNPQTALGDTVRMLDEFGSFRDTREILLGGVLNKHNSVQANNFSFAADESLKNLHIEYAMPETKTGDISWRNYSGYRMQNGGKTQIYYQKAAAEYAPAGKNWRLYALSTSGRINSEIYENTPLASFSTGFFAGKIFRHDDEYHVRLNTPFSAAEVREWELSADARLGMPESHVSIGLHKNLATKKSSARIFYRREF